MSRRTPKDARSTGRKRGRAKLFTTRRPYYCDPHNGRGCGRGPIELPSNAPKLELAPIEKRVAGLELECNHINKNILDNDPVNLEWLCKSCHKRADQQTDKGVSVLQDEFGYGI